MPYEKTIEQVRAQLVRTFTTLDSWFDQAPESRAYVPADGGWSIDELLEHITLTSHFLLLVIRKGAAKCLKRVVTQPIGDGESDLDQMLHIGHPDAFPWLRPDHMEPKRLATSTEVRAVMRAQVQECLTILEQLPRGEGSLHTVRMSVRDLGKLDMYQWLFFLALHAERHGVEIDRVWNEFQRRQSGTDM